MNILNITIIFSTAKYELAILLAKKRQGIGQPAGTFGSDQCGSQSGAAVMLVILFNDLICRWLGSDEISTWLYFIPLSTLLVGLFTAFRNYSNREKRYKLIAGANIGQSLSNSLLKLALGLVIVGAAGLIFGVVFGQLTGFLVFFAVHAADPTGKRSGWLKFSEMRRLGKTIQSVSQVQYVAGPDQQLFGCPSCICLQFLLFNGHCRTLYIRIYDPLPSGEPDSQCLLSGHVSTFCGKATSGYLHPAGSSYFFLKEPPRYR